MSIPFSDLIGQVLAPFALLILVGALWTRWQPAGVSAATARRTVNALVLNLFYPALAFSVLLRASIGPEALWIAALVASSIFLGAGLAYWILRQLPWRQPLGASSLAALVLAAAFGNIVGVGVPVQVALFGAPAARYAIYADLLATLPLTWTFGVWLAYRLGGLQQANRSPGFLLTLLRLPPIWALSLALIFNFAGWPAPHWLTSSAHLIGQAAIPGMMLTVGLALPQADWRRRLGPVLAAGSVKLILAPLLVWLMLLPFGLHQAQWSQAALLESAMPTMMASLMLADRFRLDTEILSMAILVTALAFFVSIFFWLFILL